MEYEDVIIEVEAEHEAQEELEIDLEDLEDEFIIIEEESESDIVDSFYESNSNSHAEVTSHSITRTEINTLEQIGCVTYLYYLYTSNINHFS